MKYLYGDSTESTFETNFLSLLAAAVDCGVGVLLAERDIDEVRRQRAQRESEGDDELRTIAAVGTRVHETLAPVCHGPEDTSAVRCANVIDRAAANAVQASVDAARSALASDLAAIDEAEQRGREACERAAQALVVDHDLPGAVLRLQLILREAGYEGIVTGTTPYGVTYLLDVAVPAHSPFAEPVRVQQLAPGLQIQAPDVGWIRKSVGTSSQSLSKLVVTELVDDAACTLVKLRSSADGDSDGYDVELDRDGQEARLWQVRKQEATPFDIDPSDVEPVAAFVRAVAGHARALTEHRKGLLVLTLDDTPLAELERPSQLAQRLVSALAPAVREIDRRSRAPGELVLRRWISEHRREEIFVNKRELAQRLAPLPAALRPMFEPLGLAGDDAEVIDLDGEPSIEIQAASSSAPPSIPIEEAPAEDRSRDRAHAGSKPLS